MDLNKLKMKRSHELLIAEILLNLLNMDFKKTIKFIEKWKWVFSVIIALIIIGTFFSYGEDLYEWGKTPLKEATLIDISLIALYSVLYVQITRRR